MNRKHLLILTLLSFISHQIAFGQTKIIKANSTKVNIRDGKNYLKGYWNISPEINPDEYSSSSIGEKVTFYTDLDSISVVLTKTTDFDFIIQLNDTTKAFTKIKYVPSFSDKLNMIKKNKRAINEIINVDALKAFWKIVDTLEKDKRLTDSIWENYYNLYGNRTYIENNRDEEQALLHRKYLEVVFRPSLADSLRKLASTSLKDSPNDIFPNLYYIKQNEIALRKFSKDVLSPKYIEQGINLAKKYLPKNEYNPLSGDLTLYLMALTFDAAVQGKNMFFGISCLSEYDKLQKGTLVAHEFHHLLRVNKVFDGDLSKYDESSVSIINQINNEGTADLIDKSRVLKYKGKLYRSEDLMNWLFDNADATIKKLDSCFVLNSKGGQEFISQKDFRKITGYSSGHIPGFYMSNIIKRNGLMKELIDNSDNPFSIFYLYNKAAKIDKRKPTLYSGQTIEYFQKLEQKLN